MTYDEALEYIHSVCWKGSRPGLSRITELTGLLGNPQDSLRFIHVAGTNGKGSVSAMTAGVLSAAGYKTGLFTSPFIVRFNERMQIDGHDISDEELAQITEYVRPYADSMADSPTEFELITAIAFVYFKRNNCDYVVLEVGMGGRLDSTNIIKAPSVAVSVITGIAMDHTAFLGDTPEKIAAEKAGIIKEGVPVVFGGAHIPGRGTAEFQKRTHWNPQRNRPLPSESRKNGRNSFHHPGSIGIRHPAHDPQSGIAAGERHPDAWKATACIPPETQSDSRSAPTVSAAMRQDTPALHLREATGQPRSVRQTETHPRQTPCTGKHIPHGSASEDRAGNIPEKPVFHSFHQKADPHCRHAVRRRCRRPGR